jgi:hypothetical protein
MITFKDFTKQENKIVNEFLLEAIPYFETINKTELFNEFINLLNQMKNEKNIKNCNVDATIISSKL